MYYVIAVTLLNGKEILIIMEVLQMAQVVYNFLGFREKVFSITSDTNPGLFMPTLDIRNVDLNKEIKLIRKG